MKKWILILVLWPLAVAAEEKITSFDADIAIDASGDITITETISVIAEGRNIRRGIYRDIPTRYREPSGRRVNVPIEVESVRRNGSREAWHTEDISNGIRIYFGSADRTLEPGEHTYDLRYTTRRQIGFFDDYDEFYWNATGNAWDFVIESASAEIRLPEAVDRQQLRLHGYTGPEGTQGDDYRVEVVAPDRVRFETTAAQGPGSGLTVAVGFPKGIVAEPSADEKRAMFLDEYGVAVIGAVGTLVVLLWYLLAWFRVGRDPDGGPVYPRYEAPEGYSPGMLRYVWKMGYDRSCLAAALVSLAVRGAVRLDKDDDDYVIERGEGDTESATEKKLLGKLLGSARDRLVLEQSNHETISAALKAHEKALSTRLEGTYFKLNRWWLVPGVIVTALTLLAMVLSLPGEEKILAGFLAVHQSIWNVGTAMLVMKVYRSWRDLKGVGSLVGSLFLTAFSIPFVVVSVVVLGIFANMLGWVPALMVIVLAVLNGLFWHLLRAPTMRGRKLLDQIEGLKLYLDVAEREEIEQRHADAPPQTFEEFERLLPYAVALDAADTWAGRFAAEVEAAAEAGTAQSRGWYPATVGDAGRFSAGGLGTALGSGLASATASAATAPGSSSGSGGGGSSGGGGGGGGGGGW